MCQWIVDELWDPENFDSGYQGEACVEDDCQYEYMYDDDGNYEGNQAENIQYLAYQCNGCLWDESGYSCNQLWDEQEGGEEPYCGDGDCNGDEDYYNCPDDCSVDCLSYLILDFDGDGVIDDFYSDPCPGLENLGENPYAGDLCEFIHYELFYGIDYTTGSDSLAHHSCINDCDWDELSDLEYLNYMCAMCLEFDDDCENYISSGSGFNPVISLPGDLAGQINKANGISRLNNSLSRSTECDIGYIRDCVDEDCCDEGWIADGYPDCEDQQWGCDLSCYDNDGGDCGAESDCDDADGDGICDDGEDYNEYEDLDCIPNDPCWFIEFDIECSFFGGCVWEFADSLGYGNEYCHPEPDFSSNECGWIDDSAYCTGMNECEWDWETNLCEVRYDDCLSFTAQDDIGACMSSPNCQWNPPAHS
jgi:hypothetical protein